MLLDIDFKGMPADVRLKGKPWDILVSLFPMLGNAARVERSSTSSGLYDAKTGKSYERSGGSHIYPIVQDARDIPRVIDVIFDTLWANGFRLEPGQQGRRGADPRADRRFGRFARAADLRRRSGGRCRRWPRTSRAGRRRSTAKSSTPAPPFPTRPPKSSREPNRPARSGGRG